MFAKAEARGRSLIATAKKSVKEKFHLPLLKLILVL
jgi:hypothetical protein